MDQAFMQRRVVWVVVIAVLSLGLGFVGGLIGSALGSDDSEPLAATSSEELTVKGATASTIKPGVITVPNLAPSVKNNQGPAGPPGPAGPQGPAGPAGRGLKGFQSVSVGGEFDYLGEWTATCPAGTTALTWQLASSSNAIVSMAAQDPFDSQPNKWRFRATTESVLSDGVARFTLICALIE